MSEFGKRYTLEIFGDRQCNDGCLACRMSPAQDAADHAAIVEHTKRLEWPGYVGDGELSATFTTCQVTGESVRLNTPCTVSDDDFLAWMEVYLNSVMQGMGLTDEEE